MQYAIVEFLLRNEIGILHGIRHEIWFSITEKFKSTISQMISIYKSSKWIVLIRSWTLNFTFTGCPTSILSFSKAYFSKTKARRSKIPTVLGVSWSAISYEEKLFFEKFWKKALVSKIDQRGRHPSRHPHMKQNIEFLYFQTIRTASFQI